MPEDSNEVLHENKNDEHYAAEPLCDEDPFGHGGFLNFDEE